MHCIDACTSSVSYSADVFAFGFPRKHSYLKVSGLLPATWKERGNSHCFGHRSGWGIEPKKYKWKTGASKTHPQVTYVYKGSGDKCGPCDPAGTERLGTHSSGQHSPTATLTSFNHLYPMPPPLGHILGIWDPKSPCLNDSNSTPSAYSLLVFKLLSIK